MGETIVVTDDNGTEYEVDKDDLRSKKTISFFDNGGGELKIPYSADYEVANRDSMWGDFAVGFDCEEVQGFGTTTGHKSTFEQSWNKMWKFDEMTISE